MLNPFYIYFFSNIITLLLYSLDWSDYYQGLDFRLYFFLAINSLVSLIIGRTLRKKLRFRKYKNETIRLKIIIFLIILGYFVDYLYSKEIPIINILLGVGNYYKDVKHIPTFYPVLSALNVFYFIYISTIYLNNKEKKYLYAGLFLLLPLLMGAGRGLLVMAIAPVLLVYFSQIKIRFSIRKIARIFLVLLVCITIFGYLGDIRSVSKKGYTILDVGSATISYKDLNLPNGFFWVYLYTASPLGNLNNTLKFNHEDNDFSEFLVYNFTPQSLQKRILGEMVKDKSYLVVDTFNVSTMFGLPYTQMGWLGIILFQILLYTIFFIFFIFISPGHFRIIFLSIFSSIMLLSNFANILILDIIFIPMVICVLLSLKAMTRLYK